MANLNTLQEMIIDEEKLVTYVSLSKELCIHVNESKMLLRQIVENVRQKKLNIDLNVNYIISGTTDKNAARTAVCTEAEKEVVKKEFNAIFFEHIYSVSKGYPGVDSVSILSTNKIEDLSLCTGLIKSSNCVKRTAAEIGTLKSNSQDLVLLLDEKTLNTTHKKIKKDCEEKSLNELENKKIKSPEKTLDLTDDSTAKKVVTSKQKVNNGNIRQKGIAGFLSKSNGNSIKKEVSNEVKKKENNIFEKCIKKEIKVENVSEGMEEDKDKSKLDDIQLTEKEIEKEKNCYKKADYIEEKKSPTVTKKNLKIDKKRKRIVVQSDSDSEKETNENDPFVTEEQMDLQNESEDEIPCTPLINTFKITSGIVNPKKRRKIVDKTYTSEDGYIHTKKEEVYESCSDNEEALCKENVEKVNKIKVETSPKEKKSGIKNSKKKISPPKAGKQPTLMNFFKKATN